MCLQVVGEVSGLTSALMSEKSRSAELLKHKESLEEELAKVRKEWEVALNLEKAGFEKRVAELLTEKECSQDTIKSLEARVSVAEGRQRAAEDNLEILKVENLELGGKLELSETARCAADEAISRLGGEVNALKETLEGMPRRESIVAEFRSSEEFKQELIEARVSAVGAYQASEEFSEAVQSAVENAVNLFKQSVVYSEELDEARKAAVADFRRSVEFKQAVGAEVGKVSIQVVECCREFFKEDFGRPAQEFGVVFTEFMRRRRSGASGSSTRGSPVVSSTR